MSKRPLTGLTKKHCSTDKKRTTAKPNTPHREHKKQTVLYHKCGLYIVGEGIQLLTLPKRTSADLSSKHADCVGNERTIVLEFYKQERENEFSIEGTASTLEKKLKEGPLPATETGAELE